MAITSVFFALFFGAADLSGSTIVRCLLEDCGSDVQELIFWQLRFPRVIVGFLVGAGLAISGATLQHVTRNSLADPYLFGVVAGAGFGASLFSVLLTMAPELLAGFPELIRSSFLTLFAFTGALIAVLLVYAISCSAYAIKTEKMLLAGIAVSFMLSAMTHFLLFVGDPLATHQIIFWLMGSLSNVDMIYMLILLIILLSSASILWFFGPRLDALLLGDISARSLGVDVIGLRVLCLMTCALLTAVIVAYCGGIGFVGLMIPHIVRHWLGVTFRTLLLGCLLLGGIFMVWVDVVARALLPDQEMPIGIITAAIGSVFFLLIMKRQG